MAKLFCTEAAWSIVDHTLQIRGGRGYETALSLKGRGEAPLPVERMFRDARINLIIEGTSEIMRLFLAREALDPHLQKALGVLLPKYKPAQRVRAGLKAALFYAGWYPRQWLPVFPGAPAQVPAELRGHWRFIRAQSRVLARTLFHQMLLHQQKLEKRQLVLFRIVDVGVELFVMAAAISRAAMLKGNSVELADLFCRYARQRVQESFRRVGEPLDRRTVAVSKELLQGEYRWLEEGIVL